MNYAYKLTTHGRAMLAACMALEKPLKIVRVAFGSGKVEEDVDLADVHELLSYISDGAVADRQHKDDRLTLTIQYANIQHQDIKMFLLSEFIVYTENPETGEETDLLYGNLGDYRQPVPAYNQAYPPSVFSFPLEIIISDEINVSVSAPSGIVTHDELIIVIREHSKDTNANPDIRQEIADLRDHAVDNLPELLEDAFQQHNEDLDAHPDIRQVIEELRRQLGGGIVRAECLELTIPPTGWTEDTGGIYPHHLDIPHTNIAEDLMPALTILPAFLTAAEDCQLCPTAQTLPGALRVYAKTIPAAAISASLLLIGGGRDQEEIIIPTVGWVPDEDTGGEYPLHVDMTSEAAAESLTPLLTILPDSMGTAAMCCISPFARTLDDILRVYAKAIPDRPVNARLTLLGNAGKESGGSYTLPAATATSLGGVKVRSGSGLTVDSGGNLKLDTAPKDTVVNLFKGSNG